MRYFKLLIDHQDNICIDGETRLSSWDKYHCFVFFNDDKPVKRTVFLVHSSVCLPLITFKREFSGIETNQSLSVAGVFDKTFSS